MIEKVHNFTAFLSKSTIFTAFTASAAFAAEWRPCHTQNILHFLHIIYFQVHFQQQFLKFHKVIQRYLC